MNRSFSAAEFITALSEGSLKPLVVLEGMVKLAEQDRDALLFSWGTGCVGWTRIPVEMIDKVEYITTARCHGHEHPYVCIQLKEVPDNPAAALFADLLRQRELNPQPLPP